MKGYVSERYEALAEWQGDHLEFLALVGLAADRRAWLVQHKASLQNLAQRVHVQLSLLAEKENYKFHQFYTNIHTYIHVRTCMYAYIHTYTHTHTCSVIFINLNKHRKPDLNCII